MRVVLGEEERKKGREEERDNLKHIELLLKRMDGCEWRGREKERKKGREEGGRRGERERRM